MVILDKEVIDVSKRISDSIEGSRYYINRFKVLEDGNLENNNVIQIDLRRKQDAKEVKDE